MKLEIFVSRQSRINVTASFCIVLLTTFLSIGVSIAAAQRAIVRVSSASELMGALERARGGETIFLQPGDYGDLVLQGRRHPFVKFAKPVTIKSADLQDLATFKSVKLSGVENLSFASIRFDYVSENGAPIWTRPNEIVDGSKGITIEDSVFDGDVARGVSDVADGYGAGFGLFVAESTNITIQNNKFFNWNRAAVFTGVTGLKILNNDVFNNRSDGLNFVNVNDVLIEGNHIHDFVIAPGSDDHPDMIQFWTSGTTSPSTNIVIRGNVLNSGRGSWTQSIFIRNEMVDTGRAGDEMFYRDVTIEDNVIYNAHAHGISVGETHRLTIKNNTVLHNRATGDDKLVHVPRILLLSKGSTDVLVSNNIVSMVGYLKLTLPTDANAKVQNNLIAQRDHPGEPNYYGRLFVNALSDGEATLADLRAMPGGLVEQMKVGSTLIRFPERPNTPTGYIEHQPGIALSSLRHNFNVRNLFGPEGRVDTKGASVAWNFGDGRVGQGLMTAHTYSQAGKYIVRANVTLPGGREVHLSRTIMVVPPAAGNRPQ